MGAGTLVKVLKAASKSGKKKAAPKPKKADEWDEAAWLLENPRPHPEVKIKDHTPDQRAAYKRWEHAKRKAKPSNVRRKRISERTNFDEGAWIKENPAPHSKRPIDMSASEFREHKTWLAKKQRASMTEKELDARRGKARSHSEENRELMAERARADYHKHREKRLKDNAARRAANPERTKQKSREYYRENKERILELRKKSYNKNPEKHISRAVAAEQQRALRDAPWADQSVIDRIYKAAADLTESSGTVHHVDHVIPLRGKNVSGLHHQDNLLIMPAPNNMAKHNKFEVGDDPLSMNAVAREGAVQHNKQFLESNRDVVSGRIAKKLKKIKEQHGR